MEKVKGRKCAVERVDEGETLQIILILQVCRAFFSGEGEAGSGKRPGESGTNILEVSGTLRP